MGADNRVVFHFNKASLGDVTIPPWVVKARGQTHYVWHLDSQVGFSTKETPDSPHTKGSLQFRGDLTLHEVGGNLHALILPTPAPLHPEAPVMGVPLEAPRASVETP